MTTEATSPDDPRRRLVPGRTLGRISTVEGHRRSSSFAPLRSINHVVTVSERAISIVGLGRRWTARCTTCAWTTRCTDRRDRDEAAREHERSA